MTDDKPKDNPSPLDLAFKLVSSKKIMELWLSPDDEVYMTVQSENHPLKNYLVSSKRGKQWLLLTIRKEFGPTYPTRTLDEIAYVLEAQAYDRIKRHTPAIRTGETNDARYIDLCNEGGELIKITAEEWLIKAACPAVKFVQPKNQRPLPTPQTGGSLEALREFVNVRDEDAFRLLIVWIITSLCSNGDYPIVTITGEHGSAKSTLARILHRLIDPSKPELRSPPTSEENLLVAAKNCHVLCFDNLSGMQRWLPDALCRLATGGGMGKRQNYTDGDEYVIEVKRPVILNGIADLALQHDMIDRTLNFHLPTIHKGYKPQDDFWKAFEGQAPLIFGAILDVAVIALRNIPTLKGTDFTRMAEFCRIGIACETALDWEPGGFLRTYNANRGDSSANALEGDPLAQAILNIAKKNKGVWTGTATELLGILPMSCPAALISPSGSNLPKSANALSGRLRRISKAMYHNYDVLIEFDRQGHSGTKLIKILSNHDHPNMQTIADDGPPP